MKKLFIVLILATLAVAILPAQETEVIANSSVKSVFEEYTIRALNWLESGAGWVEDQIPLYIEELLNYRIIHHKVWLIVYTIPTLIALFLIIFGIVRAILDEDWDELMWSVVGIIPGLSVIGLVYHLLEIYKISIAPRVYLLEYFTDLL